MAENRLKIVRIPLVPQSTMGSTAEERLIRRSREFRLYALQTTPEAFASSYDEESQRDLDYFRSRLSNPKATTFVALKDTKQTSLDVLEECSRAEWLGVVVLLGPHIAETVTAVSASTNPWLKMAIHEQAQKDACIEETPETRLEMTAMFHLSGMFVSPAARGRRLGEKLIGEALNHGKSESRRKGVGLFRCALAVDDTNIAAKAVYRKMGFEVVAEEMYQPRPVQGKVQPERKATRMGLYEDLR
ncbi:hypothetical protein H2203_003081 [Taxawa tesnikishii (nom. ined.)]|nr:hypothetical protein H2203_003081 [Dothideales sp. JES 119]